MQQFSVLVRGFDLPFRHYFPCNTSLSKGAQVFSLQETYWRRVIKESNRAKLPKTSSLPE